uniref:Uncharacterized protein n=1 Tax=Globodera rostochiensis TaxID=31243 RepID=A0A914HA00_GLORO
MTKQVLPERQQTHGDFNPFHSQVPIYAKANNTSMMFADKVKVLANLTMHLRDCLQANNAKPSCFLVKSIHEKNLANDFVRCIWKIPLHETQGIDTVDTLLRLLEGMMSKIGAREGEEYTGEGMAHHQEQGVHEGAMENGHFLHSHLVADDDLEEMDDDDALMHDKLTKLAKKTQN